MCPPSVLFADLWAVVNESFCQGLQICSTLAKFWQQGVGVEAVELGHIAENIIWWRCYNEVLSIKHKT